MLSSIFIAMALAGMLPAILMAPHAGIFIWCWISYMNPHKFTWGFVAGMPLLDSVAALTMITWLTSKERKLPPLHVISVLLALYFFWTCLTTIFAANDLPAQERLLTFTKIILFTFFTMIFITNKQRLRYMIYIVLLGLSLFSTRGGIFTILNGGKYIVYGPSGTFLADNNQLALAFLTVTPLCYWVFKHGENLVVRYAGALCGVFTLISVLGSHSRGALVALAAMAAWMVVIGRRWVLGIVVGVGVIGGALTFMPDAWVDRMTGISEFEEDKSASTRLHMWKYASNVAQANPVVGGGFLFYGNKDLARKYMPGDGSIYLGHSIYYDTLGEHGFVGLALFLMLMTAALVTTSEVRRITKNRPDQAWARDLAQMLQFSLVGFATGGAFLSLAIFDLYYHIVAISMMVHYVILAENKAGKIAPTYGLDDMTYGSRKSGPALPGQGIPAE